MYAVVDHKSKQYKVFTGDEILLDLIDVPVGELVALERVLMIGDEEGQPARVGRPQVPGARVLAEVLRHEKGPKVTTIRFKGPHQTQRGHRQRYTRVRIQEIHPE